MTDSKGFIFYIDNKEVLEILSDEQLGHLMRLLIAFAETKVIKNDIDDIAVNMAYRFITAQMQRDFAKYDQKCKKNAENGKKGGRPCKNANGLKETEKSERFSKKAKKAYTNTDTNTNILSLSKDNDNIKQAGTAPLGAVPPADENLIPWDEVDFELV